MYRIISKLLMVPTLVLSLIFFQPTYAADTDFGGSWLAGGLVGAIGVMSVFLLAKGDASSPNVPKDIPKTLVGVSKDSNELCTIDPDTSATISCVTMSLIGKTIEGGT